MNNPKSTLSIIVSVLLIINQFMNDNSELFGFSTSLLTKISLLITLVSVLWKTFNPEESAISMIARHVGIRLKKPRG